MVLYWQINLTDFAGTGQWKEADYHAHHVCLEHLVNYYVAARKAGGHHDHLPRLVVVWVDTDGCPGQYACRQNYVKIAMYPFEHKGVIVAHTRAITGEFKGLHDSAGGISTAHHQKYEKIGEIFDPVTGKSN